MSALPLRRYRVLATATLTLAATVKAESADAAEELARTLWTESGEDCFSVKDCSFDVVFAEEVPS
jgi:hypothetical protein